MNRLLNWKWCVSAVGLLLPLFADLSIHPKAGNPPLKSLCPDNLEKCLLHKGLDVSSITFRDRNWTSAQYDVLNYQWNKYKGEIRPFAYILPRTVQEVQATIQCARSLGIRVVARSGGHSAEKYCFGNSSSLIIDFQKQDAVSMDMVNKTVEVQSGVRSQSKLLTSGNYFLPHGICKTVGISYSLGGGYTTFVRMYGHVLNLLLELDMVDYKGSVITANKHNNSDLFWALRGGGAGGSFGLVTRYKFELRLVPNKIIYGVRIYPIQDFPQVLAAWQTFGSSNTDRTLFLEMIIGKSQIELQLTQIIMSDMNSSPATVIDLFQTLFPDTNNTEIYNKSYDDYLIRAAHGLENLEGGDAAVNTDNRPVFQKQKSFFVKNLITQDEIKAINVFMQNATKYITTFWHTYGGILNDIDPQETAFAHTRGVLYQVNLSYMAPLNRTQSDEDESLLWLRGYFEFTRKIMGHDSSYQNVPDNEMKDFLQRYYGVNLKRLQEVKRKYDPENYFQYEQSIPPI